MKKRAALLLYIVALALLAGCRSGLLSSRRDTERLRPIQAVGLDRQGDRILLSVSSGVGPDKAPALVMQADAESIEAAVDRVQDYSPEDELFYAHVRYILLGESLADGGVTPVLDWVARSPAMHMGTLLFIVKDSAAAVVTGAAGEGTDVTERLASLEREEIVRGLHLYNLREVSAALLDRGCALCFALEGASPEGIVFTETDADSTAVLPAGYAVLTPDRLAGILTGEETLGTEILLWGVNGAKVNVAGNALELLSGNADVEALRDENGAPTGLRVRCELHAGLLEQSAGGEEDPALLKTALAEAAEGWLLAAISRSRAWELDFLDLRSALASAGLFACGTVPTAREVLSLPVTVEVRAELQRTYDLIG